MITALDSLSLAVEGRTWQELLVTFYGDRLRPSLFTGFLTLTGFLFAMKTFIVINLRKEVYEHPQYHLEVATMRAVDPNLTIYAPLQRLSRLLAWSVGVALATSLAQFSIGLVENIVAVIFCLILALLTIGLVIADLIVLSSNLRTWFRFLELQAKQSPTSPAPPPPTPPAP